MACQGILSAAVTVKLTRTLAIIPITLILALIRMQRAKKRGVQAEGGYSFKKVFPFFILFFIAAALITTVIGVLPESGFTAFYSGSFVTAMKWLAKFFIAMAMCAIGLNTNLIDLVKKGGKADCCRICLLGYDFSCFHSGTAGNRNFLYKYIVPLDCKLRKNCNTGIING